MHETELLPGGGLRFDEDDAGISCERAGHESVLVGGKNVRPDIDLIPGRVDDVQRGGAGTGPSDRDGFFGGRTSVETG